MGQKKTEGGENKKEKKTAEQKAAEKAKRENALAAKRLMKERTHAARMTRVEAQLKAKQDRSTRRMGAKGLKYAAKETTSPAVAYRRAVRKANQLKNWDVFQAKKAARAKAKKEALEAEERRMLASQNAMKKADITAEMADHVADPHLDEARLDALEAKPTVRGSDVGRRG